MGIKEQAIAKKAADDATAAASAKQKATERMEWERGWIRDCLAVLADVTPDQIEVRYLGVGKYPLLYQLHHLGTTVTHIETYTGRRYDVPAEEMVFVMGIPFHPADGGLGAHLHGNATIEVSCSDCGSIAIPVEEAFGSPMTKAIGHLDNMLQDGAIDFAKAQLLKEIATIVTGTWKCGNCIARARNARCDSCGRAY